MNIPEAPTVLALPNESDDAARIQWLVDRVVEVNRYINRLRLYIAQSFLRSEPVAWEPGAINDGAVAQTDVEVVGATLRMSAVAAFSEALPAGLFISATPTAADVVTVTIANLSGGLETLGPGTLRVDAFV